MGKVKGCINKECVSNQKKITYKNKDDFCPKCGHELYFVCKKCYTQLSSNSKKYCERCLAEKDDKKNKRAKDVAAGAGVGVGGIGIGLFIRKNIPKAIEMITKLKG